MCSYQGDKIAICFNSRVKALYTGEQSLHASKMYVAWHNIPLYPSTYKLLWS